MLSSPLGYDPSLDQPIDEPDPAQQSLRDRQLRTLFETALDGMAIADDQGRYLDVNPAACELFGLERDELLGRCISEFAEPGFNFQQMWQEFQQQEKVRGEFQLVRPDGEIRVVEYAATANFLPHRHLSVMRDITNCQRAEAKIQELSRKLAQTQAQLRKAEIDSLSIPTPAEYHRLEQIARHIPGVIYQFRMRPDGTFHFLYASEGLREVYGFSPEEVREDAFKIFTVIHSDDLDRVSQSIVESAEHLTPWYCEYRVCLPNQQLLWLLGHATPQREPDGSTLWHGYIRDITESKSREIALRESETKFSTIFHTSPDPAWIATLTEGRCLNVNESLCKLLETTYKDIIGKTCVEIGLWDNLEDLQYFRQTLVQQGSIQNFEVVIRTSSRQAKTVLMSAKVEWLDGQDCVIGMIKDISDRKQAEIENWQIQNFLNSIIENIPNMLFVKDAETLQFVRFNKAGEELLGYPKEALLGKSDYDFFPPEEAEFFIAKDREVLAKGKVLDIPEEPIQTNHQGPRILHTRKIPILDELGNPKYLLGISEDITERKQAEAKLIEITQLQQAILDGANYAIVSTDTNGIIKTFNAAAQRCLGYSSAEMVDQLTPAVFHDLEEVKQRATELTAELGKPIAPGFEVFVTKARLGIIDEHEWSYLHKDGSRFPVQLSVSALRDEEGTITGFLGIASDITARKEAEIQLKEISERLSLALKSGRIGCWEWDIVKNTLVWDERMYELYGVTKNSDTRLAYEIWATGLHPDDRDDSETLIRQAVLGQAEFDTEFRVVHPDGSIHFLKAFGLVQRNAEGDPQKMIGVNFDISDRKRAEAELKQAQTELKETEKFLRSIYEGVGSLIFVVDVLENRELIYTGWSLSTEKSTGIPATDVIGKTPESIFGLTEGAAVRENYLRCIESGTSIAYEECLTFNEQETWWLTILNPLKNSDDRISRIVGTTINISDRKRQEQALRLIVEGTAAKTGKEFFKSCAQYLAQVLGVRYAVIAEFVNPEKSIAQTLAFWEGDNFGNNFTCNLAETACKNTPCKNISSATEVCRYSNSVECLFPQDDALVSLKTQSYAGLPIIDAAGNHLGLLEVMDTKPMVKDLEMQSAILKIFATRAGAEMERIKAESALRQSEIQLRQQTEELEAILKKLQNTQTQLIQAEKMSSLGQLVAGVAHEINNPVSFIYSNIQPATDYASHLIELIHLYQEYYPSPPQAISDLTDNIDFEYLVSDFSKLLESMKNGATRISNIVKSLRTFSRLDEADLKPINIHENIESTLVILQNRLNGRAGKPEIHLNKNYGKLPLVECYGGLLNQVFMNLLVNAIDAIEQQRESLETRHCRVPTERLDYLGEITITTSITSENQVFISIHDNGCGMSPEVQEKIFNPFFTTKPVGKGTGMGLATSYQIITENHQGILRCFSTLGKGTEFRIELAVGQL